MANNNAFTRHSLALEQLIAELKKLREAQEVDADIEENHRKADMLLLDYINNKEVTHLFLDLDRWYA